MEGGRALLLAGLGTTLRDLGGYDSSGIYNEGCTSHSFTKILQTPLSSPSLPPSFPLPPLAYCTPFVRFLFKSFYHHSFREDFSASFKTG